MLKLLIIADDFTGALDAGVRYAGRKAATRVIVKKEPDFYKAREEGVEVLVWNAESRHLEAGQAYKLVYDIVQKARIFGIPYIYKKTDSGLRGNIASELKAVLKASGESFLPFLPAFPVMNRVTIGGVQYADGLKLEDSVYGKDPFEPSKVSYIPDLFKGSQVNVEVYSEPDLPESWQEEAIGVFDARTQEDLERTARRLMSEGKLSISGGCAGFASVLADILGIGEAENGRKYGRLPSKLFVACGSLNMISKEQLDFAQKHGFCRITIQPEKHLQQGYLETEPGRKWIERLKYHYTKEKCCILDTALEDGRGKEAAMQDIRLVRSQVGNQLGKIMKNLLDCNVENTVLIVGGDTLLEFFECMGCDEMIPVAELKPGLVLSEMYLKGRKRWVISKSGGFGSKELLVELADEICGSREERNG